MKQFEIQPVDGAIAIRIIDPVTPNQWEYYQFSAIKSVVPVSIIDYGLRDTTTNIRKNPVREDDKLEFIINFHDENESAPLRYNIKYVDNQPGWTYDLVGLAQALADINSWIGAGSGAVSAALLAALNLEATQQLVLTQLTNLNTKFTVATRTVTGPTRVTGAGTVAAGARKISFFNAGGAAVDVNGGTNNVEALESFTIDPGGEGDLLPAIAYDATGSTLVILVIS
jgi:hypothetical protein